MKKLTSILIILALALAALPAMAAEGDAILGRGDETPNYYNYAFPVGDTLYLVSGGTTLYTYRLGDADLTERQIAMPEHEGDDSLNDELMPFSDGEALYALDLMIRYDEHSQFEGAALYRLTEGADGGFTLEKTVDVDWSDLMEYYDEDSYPIRPESPVGLNGKVFFRAYDNGGDYRVYALQLDSGKVEPLSELRDINGMTLYRDGALLMQQYSYDQPDKARLVVYDPADESLQPLGEVEVPQYSPLQGLAYDAASDTVYCAKGGEICPVDLQAGQVGAGITDMPLEIYSNTMAFVMEGGFYAACSEGACVRNLDPGQRAEVRLKINDNGWNECVSTAYYRYSNAHGDVSTVLSRDWNESQNLLESMMNRDDSIDIYVLSTNSTIYDALYKRGYLMELDSSEKLKQLTERMYPDIREALSPNGHLVAIPVDFNSWTLGVNEKALEKMGMTLEDVPDNWMDFLDFLAGLEEPLKENKMHLFYAGYSARDARNDLFNSIFEDYQRYVSAVNPTAGYNTDLLRGLLTKLEQLDFVALGLPEVSEDDEEESSGMISYGEYGEDTVLMQTSTGCTIGNFYSNCTPMLMGLDANTPMPLVLRTEVAVVNPFTRHPEQAIAFMEELADSLNTGTLYCMDPSLNEPIRGEQNEQSAIDAQKWVDDAKAELADADEADRQMLEENLQQAEENLKYWDEYGWEVSQRDLDWYRGHDDHIALAGVEWLYADESGEAWELISQYMQGKIGMDEMLTGIDRKVQMMLLEGN